MLKEFARTHDLKIRQEYKEDLQQVLDTCFSLDREGIKRSFGQLSSLIDGEGSIWLFRTVELLDLNPHAQSYSTHFPRIVALFDISAEHNEYFVLDKNMQARKKLSGSRSPDTEITEIVKQIAESCQARHPLLITLTRGHGLIYFEPSVTGGETLSDVNSLYCIAKKICKRLSDGV